MPDVSVVHPLAVDGFALLPGFIRPGELKAVCAMAEDRLAVPLPVGCERPHNTLAPLRWSDPLVSTV
jgi:hypothetical protein